MRGSPSYIAAHPTPYHAYGGLFKTQELLPNGVTTPEWTEAGLETKPRPPTNSRPIDQTEYAKYHRELKAFIGNEANDKTSIAPNGDVWRKNHDGRSWTNYGDVHQMYYPDKRGKK